MSRSDALLIQGEHTISSETIPSKVYEHLHIGRPILALVHTNPELEQMLLDRNHFPTYTSPENICEALLYLYQGGKEENIAPAKPSLDTIQNAVSQAIDLATKQTLKNTSPT